MSLIKLVDKLSITFLVDNCIEWFTPLPDGFTHELITHLTDNPPIYPRTGVARMDFDNYCCGAHGFAALIETQVDGQPSHFTLFDTGPDNKSLIRNIAAMKTPISKIERVVLSHWHCDHTGGLLSLLNLRKESDTPGVIVDVQPDRPISRGITRPPKFDKVIMQLSPDPEFDEMKALGAVVEPHPEGHAVADGAVWVSGEIPRVTAYEKGLTGAVAYVEDAEGKGTWVPDTHIMDERYVAIDVKGKGLVIFSACSHAGIVNVVRDAVQKFKRPIHMVIGGLHLAGTDMEPRIPPTVEFLTKILSPAPNYVLPMHCSGFKAKCALKEALGEGCVPAGVGIKVEVRGSEDDERRLFPPTIKE